MLNYGMILTKTLYISLRSRGVYTYKLLDINLLYILNNL